jgi:hypothetical protein
LAWQGKIEKKETRQNAPEIELKKIQAPDYNAGFM